MRWTSLLLILGAIVSGGCDPGSSDSGTQGKPLAAALPGLAGGSETTESDTLNPVTRRVWSDESVDLGGQVSFDGRFLSFVDWGTGDLAVRDLRTGEIRRLTDKGDWAVSQESAEGSVVSPDGQRVAYTWLDHDGAAELRLIGMDGRGQLTLVRDEFIDYVHPEEWSRDGRHILATIYRPEETNQLVLVSPDDGSIQVIKTWTGGLAGSVGSARISPDGDWIAYDLPVRTDGERHQDIFLSSTNGAGERPLIQHPSNDHLLGWTPDRQDLLFASDRTGTLGVWTITVRGGEAQGEPRLVKPDMWRVDPLGITETGALYYGVNTNTRHIYVATVDAGKGEVLAGPTAISQDLGGASSPRWSPDGRLLAFRAQRPGNGGGVIALWSPDTGETTEVEPTIGRFGRPIWTNDSRSLLMEGRDDSDRTGFYRMDLQTGITEPLDNFWGVTFASPFNLSLDGERLFTSVWLPDGGKALQARPLEGGPVATLYTGAPQGGALSPDGETIAFVDFLERGVTVNVIPSRGGTVVELFRADEPGEDFPGTVGWSPDGNHVVFVTHPPESDQTAEVMFLPLNGGKAEARLTLEFATPVQGIRNLRFNPDGRRITFEAGSGASEVWVMENILPAR